MSSFFSGKSADEIEKEAQEAKTKAWRDTDPWKRGMDPRDGGHDDNAHPPIHPVKEGSALTGDRAKLYEYVARRFLACCSRDGLGQETVAVADLAGETFERPPSNARGMKKDDLVTLGLQQRLGPVYTTRGSAE